MQNAKYMSIWRFVLDVPGLAFYYAIFNLPSEFFFFFFPLPICPYS